MKEHKRKHVKNQLKMKIKTHKYLLIALIIGLLFNFNGFSQEEHVEDFKMLYKFSTTKQADNSRLLEVSFIARHKKDRKNKVPVFEAAIIFYNVLDDTEIKLGTAQTDNEGYARLTLPESQSYLTDAEGYINLKAVFEGTDALDSEEKELAIKDVFLELDLTEVDSVKTVVLNAFTLDSLQTKVPVEEADIIFSVGGLISNMPIEEGTLEDGEYEFEFPENIPGNSEGMVDVYAFIEDHDDFGNVLQQKNSAWGTYNSETEEIEGKLWTDIAPIWMYVVLSILLIGVWANYFYSIFNLFKIKKEGEEIELKSNNKELT